MRLVRLPRWSFYDCLFREAVMRGAGDYGRAYLRVLKVLEEVMK